MPAIKFNYKEHADRRGGSTRIVSSGTVFVTIAHELLAMLFKADFDAYMCGDMQQWEKGACTRVHLANEEMNKLPAHVSAKRGLDHGCPRCDGDVWRYIEPSTDRAKEVEPLDRTGSKDGGAGGALLGRVGAEESSPLRRSSFRFNL